MDNLKWIILSDRTCLLLPEVSPNRKNYPFFNYPFSINPLSYIIIK